MDSNETHLVSVYEQTNLICELSVEKQNEPWTPSQTFFSKKINRNYRRMKTFSSCQSLGAKITLYVRFGEKSNFAWYLMCDIFVHLFAHPVYHSYMGAIMVPTPAPKYNVIYKAEPQNFMSEILFLRPCWKFKIALSGYPVSFL